MIVFRTLILSAFTVSSGEKAGFQINDVSDPPVVEEPRSAMTGKHADEKVKMKEEPTTKGSVEDVVKKSVEEGNGEGHGEGQVEDTPEKKDHDGPIFHPGSAIAYTAEELKEKTGIVRKKTHNEYGEVLLYNEHGEELIDPGTPENQVNVILGILLHGCANDMVPDLECANLHKMLDLPVRERHADDWPKFEFDTDGYRKVLWPNMDHPDNAHLKHLKIYGGSGIPPEDADNVSHEAAKARFEEEERKSKLHHMRMQQEEHKDDEQKAEEELWRLEQEAEKLRRRKEERKREQERAEKQEQQELEKLHQAAEKLKSHGTAEEENSTRVGKEEKKGDKVEIEEIRRQFEAAKQEREQRLGAL